MEIRLSEFLDVQSFESHFLESISNSLTMDAPIVSSFLLSS